MELHQLRYVVEVAKQRHFTKAAEEICVAQSSLSQQITKLEEELGVKLFDRTTRAVQLTDAGEEFINHARHILAEIDSVKQSMLNHIGLTKGSITIGVITTLESIDFVSLITSFHKTYPGITLNIVNNGSYKLARMLQDSMINVALLTPPMDFAGDDVEFFHLTDDEFVLVASNKHPLAKQKIVALEDLSEEHFIFPSEDQSIYKIYMKACQDAGFQPNVVCHSSHCETNLALVADGMALTFFPLVSFLHAKPPGLSIIRLKNPIKKHLSLARLKTPYYSPSTTAFWNYVKKWVSQAGKLEINK